MRFFQNLTRNLIQSIKNFNRAEFLASLKSRFAIKVYITIGSLILAVFLLDKAIMPLWVRGGDVVAVPDVSGKTFEEAKRILAEKKLEAVRGYDRYDTKRPIGTVLFQNPFPQLQVKAGRHIYLSINTAKNTSSPMPDLKGRTLADAKLTLERINIGIKTISYAVVSKQEEEGIVVGQSVSAGSVLKAGAEVTLTVGQLAGEGDSKMLDVPDISGKTLGEAEKLIVDGGFVVGQIKYKYSTSLIPNTVISQSVKADEQAPSGKPIDLVVSTSDKNKEKEAAPKEDEPD
jgi:eukaryotic-like serine/threonine-protein kinase